MSLSSHGFPRPARPQLHDVGEPERAPDRRRGANALLAASAAAFAVLAVIAANWERLLLTIDEPVQRAAIRARSDWLNEVISWVSLLGTRYVIGALLLAVAAWALLTRRCQVALVVLIVAFALNPLVEYILKEIVGRARPELLPLGRGRGPSFPSGHVMASVGFYAMLPAVVVGRTKARRLFTLVVSCAVILAISFARVYVGVHWFTDVIGGLLIGAVMALATYAGLRGHRLDSTWCPGPTGPASPPASIRSR
ncbi:MAG: phosphatase PAP2 family protein [Actinomycetota bacterium]